MANVDELLTQRKIIKTAKTRFSNYVNTLNDQSDIKQLIVRLSDYKKLVDRYNAIQDSIEIFSKKEDSKEREDFENDYYATLAKAEGKIESFNKRAENVTCNAIGSTINNRNQAIQLPIINLPHFNGSYTEWTTFYDSFLSLIHDNVNITDIQKFHYLKSCLSNDAKRTIDTLSVSADNYNKAWDLLQERYMNKRLIVQNHIQELFNLSLISEASPVHLRELLDNVNAHLTSLLSQNINTENWDLLIIYLITSKLDVVTKREWESTLKNSELPTLDQLREFLNKKCQVLESIDFSNSIQRNSEFITKVKQQDYSFKHPYNHVTVNYNKRSCSYCKQTHFIYQCNDFLQLSTQDRSQEVKKLKLCFNCLRSGHDIKSCKSTDTCKSCFGKHHTLLHFNKQRLSNVNAIQAPNSNVGYCNGSIQEILLSTALVQVLDKNNVYHYARTLLDVGSQQNFITKDFSEQLGLDYNNINLPISGINQSNSTIKQSVNIKFKSLYNNYNANICCLVLTKITNDLPAQTFERTDLPIPDNIKLADPKYYESSSIDMLIGAELFWGLLENGCIKLSNQETYLKNTQLGWIIGGPFTISCSQFRNNICNVSLNSRLESQISKFWQLHEPENITTVDDKHCENNFKNTHKRDVDGRFIVHLPFKNKIPNVGSTKETAIKRFRSLENKFKHNPKFQTEYSNFFRDYIALGHMSLTKDQDPNNYDGMFLPHHGVIKESTTTRVRAVFDASCISSNGLSLNDNLFAGPNLQRNLFSLILRWRQYQFVLSADISKMYRQILVTEEHRKYQSILWRENSNEPFNIYTLNTVTYGVTSSPFLAMRCLHQLAYEAEAKFPKTSKVILNDFYMDDLLTGTNCFEEAVHLRDSLIKILEGGCFELSKWASNELKLLPKSKELNNTTYVRLDNSMETKTLGLIWDCKNDLLKYRVQIKNQDAKISKRVILSIIASIYDPIGILSPILVTAKIILQHLWQLKINWDDKLPSNLHTKFIEFVSQLEHINKIEIPRKIIPVHTFKSIYLHGFCDASIKAYGAVVYMSVIYENEGIFSNLLASKSRVAPIKTITLPRLELCAAVLLAQLISKVKSTLSQNCDEIYLWSDSTITLSWISSSPNRWQAFVANRVAEIQTLTNSKQWRHIDGQNNPADILSRGMDPLKLKNSTLWWHGPSFISQPVKDWPNKSLDIINLPEEKKVVLVSQQSEQILSVFNRVSTYRKLKRVIAYCLRFIHNCSQKSKSTKLIGPLNMNEVNTANNLIIKYVQKVEFASELHDLISNKQVANKSPIKNLNPFMDRERIIRVGGRLHNSALTFSQKHQILLPKSHIVTKLIIRDVHLQQLHAGIQATLAAVRQQFWPVAGKSAVRKIIYECIKCFRVKPSSYEQIMGNLPTERVMPSRPFLFSGVDYAGPIAITENRGRGKKKIVKTYVIVFVCLSTKAIHLELAFDYTAQSFLTALKRMMARRGRIKKLWSDNGTNFVGANRELKRLKLLFDSREFEDVVLADLTNDGIEWKFIPPNSPYMGGIWEAGVKAFKQHFKKVTGSLTMHIQEMYTLLILIESCLNSRPLIPLSNDPNDLEPLTPGHFLVGTTLTAPLEPELRFQPDNRLSRWERVEKLRQYFWTRWQKEYLVELQRRNKWQSSGTPLTFGTMVVLRDDNLPPLQWKLARVIELHPGADGTTRVVTVRTASGTTQRGVHRLCVLPISDNSKPNEVLVKDN